MSVCPKPELAAVSACAHGAIGAAEMASAGLSSVLDFSVNCNPLGPAPSVIAALAGVDVGRYPDEGSGGLRQALAVHLGLPAERIIAGNGSAELVWLLAQAYVARGDNVVTFGPTFGEYARAAAINGAHVIVHQAEAANGFQVDIEGAVEGIRSCRPRLAFLCNPNNPTGSYLDRTAVERLRRACDQGLLIIDQAYLGFVDEADSLLDLTGDGVVLLRSMTKDYGLAGLRLGYALAGREVIAALDKVRPPWNVNAMAQAAGAAALADEAHLSRARREVAEAKAYLVGELTQLGLPVIPSAANFFLVRAGNASAFRTALLTRGCCVRDCTSFGLPEFVRIGVRKLPECRRLFEAIKEVVGES